MLRFLGNWQALTAIAAMVTALGAFASVGFIFHQTRQQRKFEAFWELYREWDSPQMRAHRRRAAALLQRKDLMTNHELVTADVDVVLDFFDTVAMLLRRRVLDKQLVWHQFYDWAVYYWFASEGYVRSVQSDESRTTWKDIQSLVPTLMKHEGQSRPPRDEKLQEFLASETAGAAVTS